MYETLLNLKRRNSAAWDGDHGGEIVRMPTSNNEAVFSFLRGVDEEKILIILNLTREQQNVTVRGQSFRASSTDVFSHEQVLLEARLTLKLKP